MHADLFVPGDLKVTLRELILARKRDEQINVPAT